MAIRLPLMDRVVHFLEPIKRRYAAPPYDSELHQAESHYAAQYSHYIQQYMSELGRASLNVLDLGCGTGRLSMPLARQGHIVTAVDVAGPSLQILRDKTTRENLLNVAVVQQDLHDLTKLGDSRFDVVLCIEVLLTSEHWQKVIRQLFDVLAPGGLAFITHKPRHYFLLRAIAARQFDEAKRIRAGSEGALSKGIYNVYYNWQSLAEIKALYASIGANLRSLRPIGAFSGFTVDPYTPLCDPGALTDAEREALFQLEIEAEDDYLMSSRYVLSISQKPA